MRGFFVFFVCFSAFFFAPNLCFLRDFSRVASSTIITDENFNEITASGHWFIFVGTKWCSVCENVVEDWENLGVLMKGKVNLAIMDADQAKLTSKLLGVRHFPSFFYVEDGVEKKYEGARDLDSLAVFLEKMQLPAVYAVESEAEIIKEKPKGTVFVAKGNLSFEQKQVFSTVAAMYKGDDFNRFFSMLSNEGPHVTTYEKIPVVWEFSQDNDPVQQIEDLEKFVHMWQIPLLGEVDNALFSRYADSGKHIGICAMDPSHGNETNAKFLDNQILPLSVVFREEMLFAWVNGVRWKDFVGFYGISQFPECFFLDRKQRMFYRKPENVDFETLCKEIINGSASPLQIDQQNNNNNNNNNKQEPINTNHNSNHSNNNNIAMIIAVIAVLFPLAFFLGRITK